MLFLYICRNAIIEKDNQIFQREIFEEHYNPISEELIVEKLKSLGYKDIKLLCFPSYFQMEDFEKTEWYTILAHKEKDVTV